MLHPVIDSVRGDYYRRLLSIVENRESVREYLISQPTIIQDSSSPIEYQIDNYSIPYHDPIFPVNRPNKEPLKDLSENQIIQIDELIERALRSIVELVSNPPDGPYDIISMGSLTSTIQVSGTEHLPSSGLRQPNLQSILNNPDGTNISTSISSERLANIFIDQDSEATLHAINERYNIIRDLYRSHSEEDSYRLDDRFLASMSGEINSIFDSSITSNMFRDLSGFFIEPSDVSLSDRRLIMMRPQNDLVIGRRFFSWIERHIRSNRSLRVTAYVDPFINPELYQLLNHSRYLKSISHVPIEDTSDIIYTTFQLHR